MSTSRRSSTEPRDSSTRRNIVSVSWGDHLVFGEGDGRLATPDALRRRLERWRMELGAGAIHWRHLRTQVEGTFHAARGRRHFTQFDAREIPWDELAEVPGLAHEFDVRAYLYVSLFDEGWPLAPRRVREVSYHNAMHGQHVSWQSAFSRAHPEYAMLDRSGRRRQWGVLCLAYPEVRAHFCRRFVRLLAGTAFDGLFVCLRSQSRPADFADQFGYNEPIREDYLRRFGADICAEEFDRQAWRHLLGDYLTVFLRELRSAVHRVGPSVRLVLGVPRGDILGPPLGNTALHWRSWVRDGLIDGLVINQNSSRCPSMWHELWPMHRGSGYLQNYLTQDKLPPLRVHLDNTYAPIVIGSGVELYVARQWDERSVAEETALLNHPAVCGVVFSSFRCDNPGPLARGDWRA